jgi:sulfoxide reductase catalytic subunit YedY
MRLTGRATLLIVSPVLLLLAAAYLQWGIAGLPSLPAFATPSTAAPSGFPGWLRVTHYVNLLFLTLLIRSGLQILMDHPRLYGNVHCTPGTEWLRLTPITVPLDRVWTAKDDSRRLTPWIGLPGGRHTVGIARHWHFLTVLFWVGNGFTFVALLFATGQWHRLVPMSWHIVPAAWAVFVHYATLHLPPEPDGFVRYNPLQQLSYFAVVFVLAPCAILTGPSMSPALTNRFKWYPFLPGNRQIGRSLHFLVMCAFVLFIAMHVAMVALTGLVRNMNHIVMGTDDANPVGVWLGLFALAVVILLNGLANWTAWKRPRTVQHASRAIVSPVMGWLLDRPAPQAEFLRRDVSPFFWINGSMPTSDEWKALAAGRFENYRLEIHGLVENPVQLSLGDLRALGERTQITLHHCIQGWSGIAAWGGVPLATVLAVARPQTGAKAVVFHSFGDGIDFATGIAGGRYYDSLSLRDALNPLTMLAYEMNDCPLPAQHGAPLRLRVENQLGFKMVKWIRSIEIVADVRTIAKGEGGYAEDNEYFGEQASI